MAGQSRKRDTYDRWCAHGRLLACGAAARLPSPSPRGCQRALARLKGPRRVLSLPYKAAIAVLPVALGKCGVENSNVTVAHGIFCSALVTHQRAFQDLNNVLGLRSPLGPNFNIYHNTRHFFTSHSIVYLQGEGVRQRRRRERPDAGYGLRYLVARLVKVIHPRNRNRVPAPRNFEM